MKRYKALAEYYDAEYADLAMLQEDVPFFLGQLPRRRRQMVLELAVGTGRAAIPIAQAGHRVVGVDYAADLIEIAQRKCETAGLSKSDLQLRMGDIRELNLRQRFDWVCIFFNTFLAFPSLKEQDQVLQRVRRHLNPKGRFWLDIFHPDMDLLARPENRGLEPAVFYVPRLRRTVFLTTDIRRDGAHQYQEVTFNYSWFDEFGQAHRERNTFAMTWIFPRELQLLLERNGLRIERLWGNYDGSPLRADSPRMIARCVRM
jgi:SAM-dependent methyltransferase